MLDGLAGIGKSTVARTVAEKAHRDGWLGASFFFSRNEDDRKSAKLFFGTISFQLAQFSQEMSRHVGEALELKPDAGGKQLRDQLRDLIIQPLRSCNHASTSVILIVIDALDECDNVDAQRLLSLFLQEIHKIPNVKIFLTTRPERHILSVLKSHGVHHLYRLHDIEDSIVEKDIRLYLSHGLSAQAVQNALPELDPPPWTPSPLELNILVDSASKFFIIASTAVRFLLDQYRGDPKAQMADLMQGIATGNRGSSPFNTLDGIYTEILSVAVPSRSPAYILTRFHNVVGTIVLLQDPLALRPLARLLQIPFNDAKMALVRLQSIISLSGPEETPRIHHKSFPDFITDVERCSDDPRFIIPVGIHHTRIAQSCFRVMNEQMHTNICDLKYPEKYMENDKIRHLCDDRISPELQYACIHWATHLCGAAENENLLAMLDHFSFTHLLRWIEVFSITGRLEVAYPALDQAMRFLVGGYTLNYWIDRLKCLIRRVQA